MTDRRANLAAAALLLLLPLVLLWPSLFGDAVFTPFDPARFPPAATALGDAQLDEITRQRSNFDVSETPLLVVPEMQLARQEIDDGRFPSWNPYARFGGPLFANALAGLVYPPNWLLLLHADPVEGLALAAYLSYSVAGLLMLAFLRACGLRPAAALFGAVVFAFGGTLTVHAHFYMRMNALIWLPGMLLACLRLARTTGRARIPAAIGLAACTGMTWLAGFPPFAITASLFSGLFAAGLIARALRAAGPAAAGELALWIGAALAVGLAASAVQIAPMLAYYPESSRDLAPPPNAIARLGFDPMGLLGFVLPDAFGEPDGSAPAYSSSALALLLHTRAHWVADAEGPAGKLFFPSNYNFTEYTVFAGALPLVLALLGACARSGRPRVAMSVLAVLCVVLATAPAWLQPVYALPGFPKTPMRFIGPVCVAVAVLAALGFDAVVRRRGGRLLWTGAVVAAVAAIGCAIVAALGSDWEPAAAIAQRYADRIEAPDPEAFVAAYLGAEHLEASRTRLVSSALAGALRFGTAAAWLSAWALAGRLWPKLFGGLALATIVLAGAELLEFGARTNTHRTRPYPVDTAVQSFLRERRADGGVTIARADVHPKDALDLPSGLLFPERIRDLNAYAFLDPWSYRPFRALYGPGQMTREVWPLAFPDDARLELPMFDLFGLRYVLSAASQPLVHAGREVFALDGPRGAFRVYERPHALPRAFVVGALRELPDDEAVVAALITPDLEPRRAVLVTPEAAARLPAPTGGDGARDRAVRFRRDLPDEVVVEVAPGPPGYLVLADACLSGWNVTVDGAAAPMVRGNLFMRVVPVGPRGAEVRFHYRPPGLAAGLGLTALALVVMLVAAWLRFGSRAGRARAEVSI